MEREGNLFDLGQSSSYFSLSYTDYIKSINQARLSNTDCINLIIQARSMKYYTSISP